jgi:anti-sigma-K factor RskA
MTDIHALSGAYALDAVDDIERAAFERHLRECPACAQEVQEFAATAARIADEAFTTPPPGLRDSVLGAVGRTPQARPGRPGRPDRGDSTRDAKRWRRFAAAAVAAGVVAVGAGFGTWTIADQRVRDARAAATAERNRIRDIEAVLAAPDAHLVTDNVDGGRVSVWVAPSQDKAVAILSNLPELDRQRVYQLWQIHGTTPTSLGPMDPGQTAKTVLIHDVRPADKFAITVEKAGGVRQPTTAPITSLPLR